MTSAISTRRPPSAADLMAASAKQADIDLDTADENTEIRALGIDSLAMLDLVYDVQQAFGIEFEAQELMGVKTVGELADFIEARAGL